MPDRVLTSLTSTTGSTYHLSGPGNRQLLLTSLTRKGRSA